MRPPILPLLALLLHSPASTGQNLVKIMSADAMHTLHIILDANSDGSVSAPEGESFVSEVSTAAFVSQAAGILQTMDSNGDGRLGAEEFAADLEQIGVEGSRGEGLRARFSHFDRDSDGTLTLDEAAVLFCYLFRLQPLDADGDGALGLEEFLEVATSALEKKGATPYYVEQSAAEGRAIFGELDADGDGVLDPHEFYAYESGSYAGMAAWRMFFELADGDRDGGLTVDEMVKVRENQGFGGSAAYYHSKRWIEVIETLKGSGATRVSDETIEL